MPPHPSLVLITVDCLRADHVGCLGYPRATTPFLDALATESFLLSNAIVAGAPTYYSIPAILASRYPLALGRDVVGLGASESTLPSALKRSGYRTAAFCAGNPYLSHRFGYDKGFDRFEDFLQFHGEAVPYDSPPASANASFRSLVNHGLNEICHQLGPACAIYDELYFRYCQRRASSNASFDTLRRFPSADVIVKQASDWISSRDDRPFFLWLHLMDPHAPYYPQAEAVKLLRESGIAADRARYFNSYWNRGDLAPARLRHHLNEIVDLYDACVRWVDIQIGHIVEILRALDLWRNCVLAVTADHGEEFLEHGGRYHPPSQLTEELIRVPLLLRVPGNTKGAVCSSPFSLIHLAPTLLSVAGVQPPENFQGRNRWQQLALREPWDEATVVECVDGCTNPFRREGRLGDRLLAVRESRYKLVFNFATQQERLFDLEADPGELQPLSSAAGRAVRRRLLDRARQHLEGSIRQRDQHGRITAFCRDLRHQHGSADRRPVLA